MSEWEKIWETETAKYWFRVSENDTTELLKQIKAEGDNMAFNLKKRVDICNKLYENNRELSSKLEAIRAIVDRCYDTGLPKLSETLVMRLKGVLDE